MQKQARTSFVIPMLFVGAIVACAEEEAMSDLSTDEACDAVEACEGATGRADCEALFDVIVASSACLDAVQTASCEDHAQENAPYIDVCAPPCDGSAPVCHDDGTLTGCLPLNGQSRLTTVRCEAACETQGLIYSGACGRAYEGQTTSQDQCWCRTGEDSEQ